MPEKKFKLVEVLRNHQSQFHSVLPEKLRGKRFHVLDLSRENKALEQVDLNDEQSFGSFISSAIENDGATFGIGKYNEDRYIYRLSNVFTDSTDYRSIHIGLDLWYDAGLPVHAPLDGTIHSFQNNDEHGNYGPTIILSHTLENMQFYTLYGHLSKSSLLNLKEGQRVSGGTEFAQLGTYAENVHWPPHLHFQVIKDIGSFYGDYPGVCSYDQRDYYLDNCPDPDLILGLLS